MKTCTRCQLEKSVDDFYKTSRGTPSSWCKSCQKEAAYASAAKTVKAKRGDGVPEGYRKCTVCGVIKLADRKYFYKSCNYLRAECKMCTAILYQKKRVQTNERRRIQREEENIAIKNARMHFCTEGIDPEDTLNMENAILHATLKPKARARRTLSPLPPTKDMINNGIY